GEHRKGRFLLLGSHYRTIQRRHLETVRKGGRTMADILSARQAGLLLPLSALPSKHGIGDMGENARALIAMLAHIGVRVWQILPLNPLGYGNSPYQPYSSFAGDPIYLNLDDLGVQAPAFHES